MSEHKSFRILRSEIFKIGEKVCIELNSDNLKIELELKILDSSDTSINAHKQYTARVLNRRGSIELSKYFGQGDTIEFIHSISTNKFQLLMEA